MFIFPKWLHHEVYPFFGEGERLSIAMNWNVVFSDEYVLRGASEETRKQYYKNIEQKKLEQINGEILTLVNQRIIRKLSEFGLERDSKN